MKLLSPLTLTLVYFFSTSKVSLSLISFGMIGKDEISEGWNHSKNELAPGGGVSSLPNSDKQLRGFKNAPENYTPICLAPGEHNMKSWAEL